MVSALNTIAGVCGLFILSQLSPGPDVFFIFRTALARGFRGGVAVSAGIITGFAIQAALVMAAGQWLMEQWWSDVLLLAASVWLMYLAWKIFPLRPQKSKENEPGGGGGERESLATLMRQGFVCNVINPKCTLFIAALTLPPLSRYPELPWFAPALLLSVVLTNMVSWCLYCGLLQWKPVRGFYISHTRAIDGLFSILLAFFSLKILVTTLAELL